MDKMKKLSVRDLLALLAVVALICGWSVDHVQQRKVIDGYRRSVDELKSSLLWAKARAEVLEHELNERELNEAR